MGGAIPRPRSGTAAKRSNPMSKEQWLHGHRRAKRSYSTFKVRRGSGEEIPHIQGKRNPSQMVSVARENQRADTLKPYTQKTSQSNHTRTTALSNSVKLSHATGQPKMGRSWWRGLTECGPLEKGMANHFSILALRIP